MNGGQGLSSRTPHLTMALAGVAIYAVAARKARRRSVSAPEELSFRISNEAADELHLPAATVMQLGSLGGGLAVAGAFGCAGRRRHARAIAIATTTTWAGVKLVKHSIGRGRPAAHLRGVRIRGAEQSGLGFPSGHTAVAITAAIVGARCAPPYVGRLLFAGAAVTSVARMYVGAHLPLDVVGGAGIGLVVGATTNLLLDRRDES